jgi:F-type H+-transporting ATPase subunit alpha
VAGRLRLDLAQYRELEAFSAFASDLDRASRAQLDKGARLVELLKQAQYSPFRVEEEVVSVWAGTTGQLDDVPVGEIRRFEREFLDYLRHNQKQILDTIAESKKLSDDTIESLKQAIGKFKQMFLSRDDSMTVNEAEAKALEGEQERETVTRQVRAKS